MKIFFFVFFVFAFVSFAVYVNSSTKLPHRNFPANTRQLPTPSPSVNITIDSPQPNATSSGYVTLFGSARVFENVLNYRLVDEKGVILAEGTTEAKSPDVGQYGPYNVMIIYSQLKAGTDRLEVFSLSAKDGSEINKVSVPVRHVIAED